MQAIEYGWSARRRRTTTGENREDLQTLSRAAARISELAGELAERAAQQTYGEQARTAMVQCMR